MVAEIDIWRSAELLVDQHGDDAMIVVGQRADAMLEAGNMGGLAVWKRILVAVRELQRQSRPSDKALH